MDVLNDYFLQFGPVTAMQINHNRHEAIVTFGRVDHAEEAMRWPVVNDPTIGLRPWRSRAGQRGPHQAPLESDGSAPHAAPNEAVLAISSEAPAPEVASASGSAPAPFEGASNDGASAVNSSPVKGNKHLETGKLLENKRKHGELEDRRKNLLQGLTDQLKKVMAKISNPATTEKNRDQLQVILATIKDKITALTPKQEQAKPRLRVAPPVDWEDDEVLPPQPAPNAGKGGKPSSRWSTWRPRGPPSWATWQNEWVAPHIAAAEEAAEKEASADVSADAPDTQVVNAVERDQDDAENSCGETEEMDSDIEDDEALLSEITAAAAEVVAGGGEQANDSAVDEVPAEPRENVEENPADAATEVRLADAQQLADAPVSTEENSVSQLDAAGADADAALEQPAPEPV